MTATSAGQVTTMNYVAIICPNLKCKRTLQVPVNVRGKLVRCKHCSTTFAVPEEKTASEVLGWDPNAQK